MADWHGTRHLPSPRTAVVIGLSVLVVGLFSPGPILSQEGAAVLSGEVVSAVDEHPLPNAQVRLVSEERTAITDDEGRFAFSGVPPGPLVIVVSFLGTVSDPAELTLAAGELHRVRITMDVAIDPIRAEIPRSELPGKLRGFFQRMDSEQGYFITREDIEDRNPRRMTDMLRRVPGVEVGRGGIGNVDVRMGRGRACPIRYYLDGVRAPYFEIDNLAPGDVAGLEIYPGVARVPIQFKDQATCGAIVIWTRDPSTR